MGELLGVSRVGGRLVDDERIDDFVAVASSSTIAVDVAALHERGVGS
jgi:hypothetical protein